MRNPNKPDQRLYLESTYRGLKVITRRGPLVEEHLNRLHDCFTKGLDQYSRLYIVRFDLRPPKHASVETNDFIERFFSSLKAKLTHFQSRREREGVRTHETRLRFVWCRERSQTGGVHFHCAVLLNGHAFSNIGNHDWHADNIFGRIHDAWASSHRIPIWDVVGLVHIPPKPEYRLHRDDLDGQNDAFYRLSYLCKADTKDRGHGLHDFGCSRK